MILAVESARAYELEGDDDLLEPRFTTGEDFDATMGSFWPTRAQPSATSTTLLEGIPQGRNTILQLPI